MQFAEALNLFPVPRHSTSYNSVNYLRDSSDRVLNVADCIILFCIQNLRLLEISFNLYAASNWLTYENCLCFVDLLSLIVSKEEIDISLLTRLIRDGYSSLIESMMQFVLSFSVY